MPWSRPRRRKRSRPGRSHRNRAPEGHRAGNADRSGAQAAGSTVQQQERRARAELQATVVSRRKPTAGGNPRAKAEEATVIRARRRRRLEYEGRKAAKMNGSAGRTARPGDRRGRAEVIKKKLLAERGLRRRPRREELQRRGRPQHGRGQVRSRAGVATQLAARQDHYHRHGERVGRSGGVGRVRAPSAAG